MIASFSFLPLHVSNDQFPRGWDCKSKYEMELIKHVPDRLCIIRDTGIILSYLHRTLGPVSLSAFRQINRTWVKSLARVLESQGSI